MLLAGPAAFLLFSCAGGDMTGATSPRTRDEILALRAQQVFSSVPDTGDEFPGNLITAERLQSALRDPRQAARFFLLDTRPRNEWDSQGHIAGSTWIRMQAVARPENLALLPQDKIIVCISPTGHTAVQVTSVLRWLGYNAILLKHGMAGWTQTPAGQLMVGDAQGGIDCTYPVVAVDHPVDLISPSALTLPPRDDYETLRSAADSLLEDDVFEKQYPFNHIFADRLHRQLEDPAARPGLFLLDIREPATSSYTGKIEGAVQLPWRSLANPGNLQQLPKDRLIVVIDDQGQSSGQVTAILRMLGYDAVSLRSGMTAWTETPDSRETLDAIAQAHYPVVK